MTQRRSRLPALVLSAVGIGLIAGLAAGGAVPAPGGRHRRTPEPAKPVDLAAYAGLWFELGRFDSFFERGCDEVTARYRPLPNGEVEVINACRRHGRASRIAGRARVVPGSGNAKLKVSFFGPFFFGDYWVLDHADDYAWAIVGEPRGRYLWILSRTARPSKSARAALWARAAELGYDTTRIRPTRQEG